MLSFPRRSNPLRPIHDLQWHSGPILRGAFRLHHDPVRVSRPARSRLVVLVSDRMALSTPVPGQSQLVRHNQANTPNTNLHGTNTPNRNTQFGPGQLSRGRFVTSNLNNRQDIHQYNQSQQPDQMRDGFGGFGGSQGQGAPGYGHF